MNTFEFPCPECMKYAYFLKLDYRRYQCQRCGNIFTVEDGKLKKIEEEE